MPAEKVVEDSGADGKRGNGKEPLWLRCCSWTVVLIFVFLWTPAVFYGTGRHRYLCARPPASTPRPLACTHACTHARKRARMHACTHESVHAFHTRTHPPTRTPTYPQTPIHTHKHTHTDKHRFKYTLEPQCLIVLPSDLVKFGPPGFTLGHGVRDFLGVVAKPLPLPRQVPSVHVCVLMRPRLLYSVQPCRDTRTRRTHTPHAQPRTGVSGAEPTNRGEGCHMARQRTRARMPPPLP